MADKKARLVIDDLRGGRNGYDPPWALKNNECADAVNVEFYRSRLGTKRGGLAAGPGPGGAAWTTPAYFVNLFRFVPGSDETAAEMWGVSKAGEFAAVRATTVFGAFPTMKDAITGNGQDVTAASLNGKLFFAYKSAVDRLHVWDGSTIRRTGLAASAAPTAADGGGAGAYPAVLRYYRQRSTVQVGGVTVRRSEPSPSVAFTPSGANANATVTQAAVINEGETHWEVEASIDSVTFYRIATVVIGTTTYADTALTTTYNTNPLSAATGFYTLQKSYKFIAADQARILGFGAWTTTNKQDDVEFSAVIGSSDIGDDERIDTTGNYRLGLDENDSGFPTGLAGPVDGSFFAFKELQVWQLSPTGQVALPYRADALSKSIGAVTQVAIQRGEDDQGRPSIYWMSRVGPYMWSSKGLRYIGRKVEDYINGPTVFNSNATIVPARVLYYPMKRQVYFWWCTSTDNTPQNAFIYDVTLDAWSRIGDGNLLTQVTSAVMFSKTLGATMSKDLKPYFGLLGVSASPLVDIGDDVSFTDGGAQYQAYIKTKIYPVGGDGFFGEVGDALLLAVAATGITITATVTADFGLQTQSGTALLTPSSAETDVVRRFEGSALAGDVNYVQYQVGDSIPASNRWTLEKLVIPIASRGPVSQ